MMKAFFYFWRKPGMTRDEFIDYYENVHQVLIMTGVPPQRDFRRNYPVWDHIDTAPFGGRTFDGLTGITYSDREALEDGMRIRHTPPFSTAVSEDEGRLFDVERVLLVPVVEVLDGRSEEEWRAVPPAVSGATLLRLIRRPDTDDADAFRAQYDSVEAPAVRKALGPGCTDYRRNYVSADDPLYFMTPALRSEIDSYGLLRCDLIEEFTFASADSAASAATRLSAEPPQSNELRRSAPIPSDSRNQAPGNRPD